jgi:hypothetical protein
MYSPCTGCATATTGNNNMAASAVALDIVTYQDQYGSASGMAMPRL